MGDLITLALVLLLSDNSPLMLRCDTSVVFRDVFE